MLQRTFVVANENEMSNLRREIEEELQSEFRLAARDSTLNVSVIDLERSSNNFLVHLEILLPDQTTPPNISAFVPNRTLYESDVRFNGKLNLFIDLYYKLNSCSSNQFLWTKIFHLVMIITDDSCFIS